MQNTYAYKTKIHCFFFTCFNNNFFKCLHLLRSTYFYLFLVNIIEYVVIIEVVNYSKVFRQTQFTHCQISIAINFINTFPLNIVLKVIVF